MSTSSQPPQGDDEHQAPAAGSGAGGPESADAGAAVVDSASPVDSPDEEEDLGVPEEPVGSALSRRKLLAGTGIAAVVVAGGGLAAWLTTRRTPGSGKVNRALKIGYGGGVCEAPLYVAYEQKIFEKHGLDVQIVKTGSDEIKDAVGAGKLDGAPGIFFSWLKPIEQGIDAKLAAGLHEGCLRIAVPTDSPIKTVADLRNKPIGVAAIGDSAMSFFSLDLLDAGIDPSQDVDWKVYPGDQLGDALAKGEIVAIAGSDPNALLPTLKGRARELTNNTQGANREQFCCATAINGRLLREDPDVARALVTAWAEGSRWAGANVGATAAIEASRKYVAADQPIIEATLKTYGFDPSAARLRGALEPGIEKFARTGYLDRKTDPKALSDKVYADLGLTW
ncbi:ABC transporter substrate-binding protein [Nocardia sp. alder85J]|uniref:ABC transporter substrate-binding protein n=1 Tax=Nocardia sp. alder85J TaxID=2862949 RepID=UPI001CD266C9|nr:ABC transporter substrate-binding protein [Nocardia sp. alder85J]MCX4098284.1 ABC transporter substrate-binding protein [Nocardia sp. alder85J]